MRNRRIPNIRFNRPSSELVLKFKNEGQPFSAWYNARAWLYKHGYYCGSTCLSPYVAIQKGEYTLPQKVHNFDKEDMALIDGVIYSLDYRNGEVEIWLKERILHLPLKAQWYEMIESGIKTEEYRKIKPYWCKRIAYCRNNLCWFRYENNECVFRDCLININRLNYTHVKFSYGYTKRTMTFEIESITIGKGKPEWGAPTEDVFIIKLGKRV